jgi:hypothetical protein
VSKVPSQQLNVPSAHPQTSSLGFLNSKPPPRPIRPFLPAGASGPVRPSLRVQSSTESWPQKNLTQSDGIHPSRKGFVEQDHIKENAGFVILSSMNSNI